MNRLLVWGLVGALLGGGLAIVIATAEDDEGEVFIASNQPITAQQVREKLQSQGWLNLQIAEHGRYFEVTGTAAGQAKKLLIDSLTGRLIAEDDDD